MKALSDISLVARVVAFDDKRAFDALVRKYQSPIRRFFMTQTMGDEALSDDLAQETFIKGIYQYWPFPQFVRLLYVALPYCLPCVFR